MAKPALKPLAHRFAFPDAAVAAGNRDALRSSIFEVEERATGQERTLKLWRKLGGDLDKDLRELWRHEMRQVSRVMAYAGARDVIVDVLEFVEDEEEFGVLLERVGQPLDMKRRRVAKDHWLRNLAGARPRSLFWRNIQRVVTALGIVHSQGMVHGAVDAAAIMTEGGDAPDFQLGGFEWSLSLSGDGGGHMEHAALSASAARKSAASYAFSEDWRCLGRMIANCLGLAVSDAGRLTQKPERDAAAFLSNGERRLLKRLLTPTRTDQLDAEALTRAIDDLLVQLGRIGAVRPARVATEVVTRRFATERATRLLITAQGHDALDHLQTKVSEAFAKSGKSDLLIVRSATPERRASIGAETEPLALDLLNRLANCAALGSVPAGVGERIKALAAETRRQAGAKIALTPEVRSGLGAVIHLLLDAADVVVSTLNSADVESMVEAREQFDWVIVEEAAKATGPELLGVLMLSARRLLIGDHRQLPAFDADRMIAILEDHALVEETLGQANLLLGPLLRDGELDEIAALLRAGSNVLRSAAQDARGLLDPFRSFVEQDERRRRDDPNHRAISATLTEQRRMDPAIARIVSRAFYDGDLTTSQVREDVAKAGETPLLHLTPLPASPVVVVNFRHVSSPKRGEVAAAEQGGKAWHNPQEVESVVDVLRRLRAKPGERPTLAILAPYKAQVDRLQSRVNAARNGPLSHLSEFASVRPDSAFVGTVDSFQGNEADVVILSLVRNNPRAGRSALGFLQDRRRMNVALSRAKTQLIIVGSLDFLKEAVRGVNPGQQQHDLEFFNRILDVIGELAKERRGELPLATLLDPVDLRGEA